MKFIHINLYWWWLIKVTLNGCIHIGPVLCLRAGSRIGSWKLYWPKATRPIQISSTQ